VAEDLSSMHWERSLKGKLKLNVDGSFMESMEIIAKPA
jgi:hypothetical protein